MAVTMFIEKSVAGRVSSNGFSRRAIGSMLVVAAFASVPLLHADNFVKPTKEELAMTSLPGYPGAPAVVLFREEITKDDLHVHQYYERLKILTEDGKKYANVDLKFGSSEGDGYWAGDENSMDNIEGRTIHADGTIIPFTGKPYLKTIEKEKGYKIQEKIFTLPDVEVGSIIEYRYAMRYNDHVFEAPDWYIQGDLFLKAAHYAWYPTSRELTDPEADAPINAISWFTILPQGAAIQHRNLPGKDAIGNTMQIYELSVKDVPPLQQEEFMPPTSSYSYRVLYNFTPYRNGDDYWKSKGKSWSKRADSFIGPNSELRAATQTLIAGLTTDDQKLRKIYATIMALENTDYSRQHERQEDKAEGLGKVNNAADVLSHKRGSGVEMTELFVGMARAAGMKAYMMLVPNREDHLFTPAWLNMSQLDGVLAIVNMDGKDQFFDPGERYCPYGKIEWENSEVQGLRQGDNGTSFAQSALESYADNKTSRTANLVMDEHGDVTGTITLGFLGSPALTWRQRALRGDAESLNHALRTHLEESLPKSLEPSVKQIVNLEDYEKPLMVIYSIKGSIGTPTGKRLVLPVDLFAAQARATFPQEKRDAAVYFHYPQLIQDAVSISFPKNLTLEASPASSRADIKGAAAYVMKVTPAANSITVNRLYAFNNVLIPPAEYAGLRNFYSQFEAKDQESIVLKMAPVETSETSAPAPVAH